MLITCPECKLQVSDKAYACPHCGYPMREQKNESMPASAPGLMPRQVAAPGPRSAVQAAQLRTNRPASRSHSRRKHRRLPNGFGQISYLKHPNLRKPYRAMITIGKDETGRPICRLLKPEAYFRTYNEAYEALLKYHHSPYDLSKASMTMSELFDEWFQKYSETVSKGTARNVKSLWGFCEMIYDISVIELKTHDVKKCLEEGTRTLRNGKTKAITAVNKRKAKTLISMLLDYAIECGLIESNCTQAINTREWSRICSEKEQHHSRFSDEELLSLWAAVDQSIIIEMLLIECYSGWRPSELCDLTISNVDLVQEEFRGGNKTRSGKDRLVPIHPKIYDLVEKNYWNAIKHDSEYLFVDDTGRRYNYRRYFGAFNKLRETLDIKPDHKLHDCRVTFISLAKRYHVDEYAIKYIVGHAISDITEDVYTQRDESWFRTEIEKIK